MNQSTSLKRTSFTRKMPDNSIKPSPGQRKKKCANRDCRKLFVPSSPFICHCSPDCAVVIALDRVAKKKAKEAKIERAADKKKLEKFKSRSDWMREAQAVFNKYCRLRDSNLGCISCDKDRYWGGQWHAGHYKSVGANQSLRFNLKNVNKQCSQCNLYLSSNAIEYRKGLINKIGLIEVENIESNYESRKFTVDYLIRLKKIFTKRIAHINRKLHV